MVFISMEANLIASPRRIANSELRMFFTYDLGKETVILPFAIRNSFSTAADAISKHFELPFAIRNSSFAINKHYGNPFAIISLSSSPLYHLPKQNARSRKYC